MERTRRYTEVAVALCILLVLLTVGDLLALHDISRDYVSGSILEELQISLSGTLPAWTETPTEWGMVTVSWIARLLGLPFIGYVLVRGIRERTSE